MQRVVNEHTPLCYHAINSTLLYYVCTMLGQEKLCPSEMTLRTNIEHDTYTLT